MRNLLKTTILSLSTATVLFAGEMIDDPINYKVTFDNLEMEHANEQIFNWDMNAYIGYDLSKIYFYSEGEKVKDTSAESGNQIVLSKAIAPYWDIQYGLAYDKTAENDKTWGEIALMGMAPYFFETRSALLVGENGNIGLRASAEVDALITQKLILKPSAEITAYTKDDVTMGIGEGLSSLNLGLRLRYEIKKEFAPYIGINMNKNFGNTKNMNSVDETNLVTGLSIWF